MDWPKERREPRKYTPPPWEQGAEPPEAPATPAADEQVTAPVPDEAPPAGQVPEQSTEPQEPPEPPQQLSPAEEATIAMQAMAGTAPKPVAADNVPLDPATEARLDTMLGTLTVEERQKHGIDTGRIGIVIAVLIALIGSIMAVWAVVIFARTSEAGLAAVAGSCLVGFMGLFMLGGAAWIVYRARKQGASK